MRCVLAGALILSLSSGCGSHLVRLPIQGPTGIALPSVDSLHASLAARRKALDGLRSFAKLAFASPEESRRAKQLFIAQRPDHLRCEIYTPFGTAFVLTANGSELFAFSPGDGVAYRGMPSSANLARFAGLDLSVSDAIELLLGTIPVAAGSESSITADDGLIKFVQKSGAATNTAWFTGDLDPVRYEQRSVDGSILLRATMGTVVAIGDARFPTKLTIEVPRAQQRVDIELRDPEANPKLGASTFDLALPAGTRVINLDEESL